MTFFTCQNCEYCKLACEFQCVDLKLAAIHVHGTYQEYTVVAAHHVHKLPENVDLTKAAPLHCAVGSYEYHEREFFRKSNYL